MSYPTIQTDLIFDLGVHKGLDAEFYLKKGFRVVGLEAVPDLCQLAKERTEPFAERFTLINKALFDRAGESVSFFMVPDKDDWGSLDKGKAEKGVAESVEIQVETIDLKSMFDAYGTPRYLKCDMEGGDLLFREQLAAGDRFPTFVSVEMNDGKEGEILKRCGYDRCQIVNQWMHPFRQPPNPAREGLFVETTFTGEMSGPFGLELDPTKWRPIEEAAEIYERWIFLRQLDEFIAPGWLDLHVCRSEALT